MFWMVLVEKKRGQLNPEMKQGSEVPTDQGLLLSRWRDYNAGCLRRAGTLMSLGKQHREKVTRFRLGHEQ